MADFNFPFSYKTQEIPKWSGPAAGRIDINSLMDPATGKLPENLIFQTGSATYPRAELNFNSSFTNRSGPNQAALPPLAPPPDKPNLKPLKNLRDQIERKKAIEAAMKEYEELEAATQATGFQTAQNAGNIYSQRLSQQGITPVASGVVAAQARLPIYRQLAEIGTEKERTRLDAVSRADTLAAQVATTIAQLQSSHAKTLADFNLQNTAYQLDLSKFNAAQRAAETELESRMDLGWADLMTRGAGTRRGTAGAPGAGGPAGTPNWDELTALMTAANTGTGSPQAASYWQRVGGAASSGGFSSNPSFPLIYI